MSATVYEFRPSNREVQAPRNVDLKGGIAIEVFDTMTRVSTVKVMAAMQVVHWVGDNVGTLEPMIASFAIKDTDDPTKAGINANLLDALVPVWGISERPKGLEGKLMYYVRPSSYYIIDMALEEEGLPKIPEGGIVAVFTDVAYSMTYDRNALLSNPDYYIGTAKPTHEN